jgi:alpha-tubulin suppressor-like RCC1 family protein
MAGREKPTQIMKDVAAISSGEEHTLALKTDGTLWGWGKNNYGAPLKTKRCKRGKKML